MTISTATVKRPRNGYCKGSERVRREYINNIKGLNTEEEEDEEGGETRRRTIKRLATHL